MRAFLRLRPVRLRVVRIRSIRSDAVPVFMVISLGAVDRIPGSCPFSGAVTGQPGRIGFDDRATQLDKVPSTCDFAAQASPLLGPRCGKLLRLLRVAAHEMVSTAKLLGPDICILRLQCGLIDNRIMGNSGRGLIELPMDTAFDDIRIIEVTALRQQRPLVSAECRRMISTGRMPPRK